jgi:hypothetical protein
MNQMPVYVKIEEYKEVLDVIELIKTKLIQANNLLNKITDLKNEEDNEIEIWKNNIEEIERKIDDIDESLFEPEGM